MLPFVNVVVINYNNKNNNNKKNNKNNRNNHNIPFCLHFVLILYVCLHFIYIAHACMYVCVLIKYMLNSHGHAIFSGAQINDAVTVGAIISAF